MATGYSLSIIDEEMFNNKPPAFLFSTGQEEKQSHKPREWMCFGVCFVVVLSYKECLSASVFLNVGPFWRSHLVCFRRSTAPALRYSLMIVPSVSPTWKAQSNGQWRFIVFIACFFRTIYTIYIHINELHNEYILLNACKKAVCYVFYFALVCMLTTFLFSVSSVTLAIYHIKNRFVLLGSFPASFDQFLKRFCI